MKSLNEIGQEFNEHSGASLSRWMTTERAREELIEAQEAVSWGENEAFLEEMADVVLTIAGGCASNGLDLDAAIERKHAINLHRKWAPHPRIPGAVKHVKGEAP